MSRIFISYRRADSAATSGRLHERLAEHFGKEAIFKDVDDIPYGVRFPEYLAEKLHECRVELVIIGQQWLTLTTPDSTRRLDDPNDFVRLEIEVGLRNGLIVVPVLVDNATLPHVSDLPASIRELVEYQSAQVRYDPDFSTDVERLIRQLDHWLGSAPSAMLPSQPAQPTLPPMGPAPAPADSIPAYHLTPMSFYSLGFRGYNTRGIEYILPPLCPVPGSVFFMGSNEAYDSQAEDDETPQYPVPVSHFSIGQHPVTVAEYACFVRSGYKQPREIEGMITWEQQQQCLDHPVVCVTWNDAGAYVKWIVALSEQSWRLPTEAEWEKAAHWDTKANSTYIYPWGNTFDDRRCNTTEGGVSGTTPVGTYRNGASLYGTMDMAGNVWEWTSSLYKPYPYNSSDGREDVNSSEQRVLRGGSWFGDSWDARSAARGNFQPDDFDDDLGFRLVWGLVGR